MGYSFSKNEISFLKRLNKASLYKKQMDFSIARNLINLGLIAESYGMYYTTKKARDLLSRIEEERFHKIEELEGFEGIEGVALVNKSFVIDATEEIKRLKEENEKLKKVIKFKDDFIFEVAYVFNASENTEEIMSLTSLIYNQYCNDYERKFPNLV
ncbi:hypothetical protein IEO_05555 [Bacillus wiedmannii]|uniref:hypothetical protein n=1 Tax=Bacillus wiedmannii TaxID=1890302 RepID=UPI00027C193B|nr:hypothetical protein [Bacillus wiedmannii]EJV56054.1 hypothetical protein IEO_05555 [Bacillus wiedmannii]